MDKLYDRCWKLYDPHDCHNLRENRIRFIEQYNIKKMMPFGKAPLYIWYDFHPHWKSRQARYKQWYKQDLHLFDHDVVFQDQNNNWVAMLSPYDEIRWGEKYVMKDGTSRDDWMRERGWERIDPCHHPKATTYVKIVEKKRNASHT